MQFPSRSSILSLTLVVLLAFSNALAQNTGTPQPEATQPPPGGDPPERTSQQPPLPEQRDNTPAPESTSGDLPQAAPAGSSGDASIAIVLDTSHAARRDFDELTGGVETFLRWFTTEDELCLYSAGGSPTLIEEFTADKSRVAKQLDDLKPSGDRALHEAVRAAADYIRSDAANRNSAIVVFASAHDSTLDLDQVAALSPGLRVPIHVITSPGSDWRAQDRLQRLSASTGGSAYFPRSPEQLDEISEELGRRLGGPLDSPEVIAELGESANAPDRYRGLLSSYEQITVRQIPVLEGEQTAELLGGEEVLLQRVLLARLQRADIFPRVVDGGDSSLPSEGSGASAVPGMRLELLASIVEFRRGNRAQRQVLGGIGGRGAARLGVRVILLDAVTRRPVLAFTESASHASGLFGGTQEHVQSRAILEVANEIVEEIRAAR